MNMPELIPVAEPDLTALEKQYLNEAFDSGWISSTGKFVQRFEEEWAQICQSTYSLSVSNGTVALHLILAALGIGPGDEVIVPSLTFIASANAVRYVGAEPIFADSQEGTWCIDPASVASLITPKTKAIMAVHLYGNPSDVVALEALCKQYGLFLIEDAAEAPFGEVNGKRIGSFGIAASFSFYGNKILTSGEGGAVTTSDSDLYQKMKLLRGQGMDPHRRYYFSEVGFNFRLTNMQCALLCAQIDRIDEMLEAREQVYKIYDQYLRGHSRLGFQEVMPGHVRSPWLYSLLLKDATHTSRDDFMKILQLRGIETRPLFIPIHQLPPYFSEKRLALPVADMLGATGISLPTSSKMTPDGATRVAAEFLDALKSF